MWTWFLLVIINCIMVVVIWCAGSQELALVITFSREKMTKMTGRSHCKHILAGTESVVKIARKT